MVKLGDHIKIIGGGTPSKSVDAYWNGDIPWVSVKDLKSDYIFKTQDFITEEGLNNSSTKLIAAGSLVIATRMAVGKTVIIEADMAINQDLKAIKCKQSLFKKYLFYFLKSKSDYFDEVSTGATVKGIKINHISDIQIPLPPLAEQKRIAAILDAADLHRQKTNQLITKYNDLSQSLFLDMFGDPVTNPKGWESKLLGNLCGVGSSKRVFVDELVGEGIPFYRGTEIGKLGEGKQISPSLFITGEHYNRLKEHSGIPVIGDLMMPSICPDGRIWMVSNGEPFYFKDGRVLWIKVDKEKINSTYLKYLLKVVFYTSYGSIASGTTFAELKIVALKKVNILSPDLQLQNNFASRIQQIEKQKAQAEASLQRAEDLFQGLLQRAFKGEL